MPPFFSPNFEIMAKQDKFKRVIGKDGKAYYFELKKDAKGVTRYIRTNDARGSSKYVKKNFDSIKYQSKDNLTEREQESYKRSKAQRELYRFKGKPIKKSTTDILSNFGIFDPKKDKTREITKIPNLENFKRPSDIDRTLNYFFDQDFMQFEIQTRLGNAGFRGRTQATSIVDISESIAPYKEYGFKFIVIRDGEEYSGNSAYEQVREWEIEQLENFLDEGNNVAAVRTKYTLRYDPKLKVIYLDLDNDAEAEPENSEPITTKKK